MVINEFEDKAAKKAIGMPEMAKWPTLYRLLLSNMDSYELLMAKTV